MANAADIIVNLIAKTGRFNRGLKKSQKTMSTTARAARTFQRAMKFAGAALLAFGGVKLVATVRETLKFASALQRVSETVSFATGEIQLLRFAADQLDLTQQTLDLGLQRFSRRVAEAAQGQAELLKVSQKYNFHLRSSTDAFRPHIELLRHFAHVLHHTLH